MITNLDIGYIRSDRLDNSRAFVAENHRECTFGILPGERVGVLENISQISILMFGP